MDLATYISRDWHISPEEINIIDSAYKQLNPEFHHRVLSEEMTDSEFISLINNVKSIFLKWRERDLLPRVIIERDRLQNSWGIHVNVIDVSLPLSRADKQHNKIWKLFYKDSPPPDLSQPTYLFLANNPIPVRFFTSPRPRI